jgi:hypothetical protein
MNEDTQGRQTVGLPALCELYILLVATQVGAASAAAPSFPSSSHVPAASLEARFRFSYDGGDELNEILEVRH